MVPHWIHDLAVLLAVTVVPLTLWIYALAERWFTRRRRLRERDQQTDDCMRVGALEAWRRGWIKDGDQ